MPGILEIGRLDAQEIEEIAQALLAKIEQEGWEWQVKYHPDDSEFGAASYWYITGAHSESNTKLSMILGRVPWTTRNRLSLSVDSGGYTLEEELFANPLFAAILLKLEKIGREIQGKELQQSEETDAARTEELNDERRKEVKILIDKLKR